MNNGFITKALTTLFLLVSVTAYAQPRGNGQAPQRSLRTPSWKTYATRMPMDWYGSDEAKRIAENVLLYQTPEGGWPKNIPMHRELTEEEKNSIVHGGPGMQPTMDNDATAMEMEFMAKMYQQTGDVRYRKSFEKGLDYILDAQYDNGGWPQFYPLRGGYYDRITYNDNCQVNIMLLLRGIYDGDELYSFVATKKTRKKAKKAFDKGVECILNTQIYVDGEPTVWCQQHDEVTFEPAKARSYELPSFCGGESCGVIRLLMDIPNPSPRIVRSVDGAVAWLEAHKLEGIRWEFTVQEDGTRDRMAVADPTAPPIWARFYDLETQQPFFCGRDGIKKESVNDIEAERRNGYGWYTHAPQAVIDVYPAWKAKHTK